MSHKFFYDEDNILYSIQLPNSIKKINNQEVEPLKTFTIPTNITKLGDYCFFNCYDLTEIKGLEQIKELGLGRQLLQLQNAYGPKAVQSILNDYKNTPMYSIVSN